MPLLHTLLTTFLAAAAFTTTALAASTTTTFPSTLNITTLTAHNNQSVLECWALDPGYSTSAQAGVSGTAMLNLGSVTNNATNLLIPGEYDGGRHNAPTNQYETLNIVSNYHIFISFPPNLHNYIEEYMYADK
ncbi:hypothetical protein AKAW_01120 [Aspergillus niger]|uniref:Uncharacterized protein n=1 Tax=Aspergillus niger TaxID=5061 RepID=A0A100IB81_ASPNG|nr:hypothetical protein AKAW_01120 [Aspergillus niger]